MTTTLNGETLSYSRFSGAALALEDFPTSSMAKTWGILYQDKVGKQNKMEVGYFLKVRLNCTKRFYTFLFYLLLIVNLVIPRHKRRRSDRNFTNSVRFV